MNQFTDWVGFDLFGEVRNGVEAELRNDAGEVGLLRGGIEIMPEADPIEFGFGNVIPPQAERGQPGKAAADREEELSIQLHPRNLTNSDAAENALISPTYRRTRGRRGRAG